MNKFIYTIGIIISLTWLTSCEITERVEISDSGTFSYETEIDYSELLSISLTDEAKDSMRIYGQFPMDTIIYLKDAKDVDNLNNKDVSEADRKLMTAMDKTSLQMILNDTQGKFILNSKEKDVKSLNAYLSKISEAFKEYKKLDPESAQEMEDIGMFNPIEFAYDGKKFSRKNLTKPVFSSSDQDMMGLYSFKVEYKFPKPIKSTSLKGATFSSDRKTMTWNSSLAALEENPDVLNFSVEF